MTGTRPTTMPSAETHLVASTAANLAGWHDLNLRALAHRTAWIDGWWLAPDAVPSIFFRAIAVRPGADPDALRLLGPGVLAVCDPWATLDLRSQGLTVEADHPWMVRATGPAPAVAPPDDLRIERVRDRATLRAFETAAALGFGAEVPAPHTWHGPPLLLDPRFDLWVGLLPDGAVTATANSFREAGVVGIYSVSTLPDARRRGFGTALTAQAVSAGPDLPAVLQPSHMAERLYRRLGFERFTTFRTWTRSR